MRRGRLVIISGPSGVGKGTVINELLRRHSAKLLRPLTATTRPPKPGETGELVHNTFMTEEEFRRRLTAGEFLEHSEYDEQLHGTLKRSVAEALASGKDVILELDVAGAVTVDQQIPEAILIFILPPSWEELERRLRDRHTESEQDIDDRLSIARRELKEGQAKYDRQVVNPTGHPEEAVAEIEKILGL